ncbi:hapless 2-like [Falco rusticolus]|uniref:hapless 2-like n=1 Tax=Falco rusticolus TaxID=120794 RepID=UPI0018869CEF|nr:hapless 2-like [Falco rusticolus]
MGGAGARGSGGRRSPGEGRGCAGRRDRAARGPSGGGGRRETLNPRLPPLRSLARSPPLCLSGDFSSCCRHGGEGVEEEEEEGGGGGGTLRRLPPPRTRGQRRRLPAPPRARPDRKTAVTDGAAAGRAGGGRAGSTGGWRAALGRGPPGRGAQQGSWPVAAPAAPRGCGSGAGCSAAHRGTDQATSAGGGHRRCLLCPRCPLSCTAKVWWLRVPKATLPAADRLRWSRSSSPVVSPPGCIIQEPTPRGRFPQTTLLGGPPKRRATPPRMAVGAFQAPFLGASTPRRWQPHLQQSSRLGIHSYH